MRKKSKKFFQFFRLRLPKWLSALLFLCVAAPIAYFCLDYVLNVLASPPATPYGVGETLAPACDPGDTNCTVLPPAASGANSDLSALMGTGSGIGFGTTTPAAFVDIYPKGSSTDLFYIGSTSPGSVLVAKKNGYIGIGTTAPNYLLSVGADLNIKNAGAYRIGGIPVMSVASSSQWNALAHNGADLLLINPQALHEIFTVGDSISAPGTYQAMLVSLLGPSWDAVNEAISGETTGMMQTRFQNDVLNRASAEYVIIWGGVNDAGNGFASTTAETNLQLMYTAAHNAGMKVVAINIAPFKGASYWSDAHQKCATDINNWIANTAINIDYKIDSYTLLVSSTEPYTLWSKYDPGDHLHPNSLGLDRVGSSTYWNVTWTPGTTVHSLHVAGDVSLDQSLRQIDSVAFNKLSVNKIQSYWTNGYVGNSYYYGSLAINGAGGTVGIGTTNPDTTVRLNIEGGDSSGLNSALIESSKASGYGITAFAKGGTGIYSAGSGSTGTGIYGNGGWGVYASSPTSAGIGVYGTNNATDGAGGVGVGGIDSGYGGSAVTGYSVNGAGIYANGSTYDFLAVGGHPSMFGNTGLGVDPINALDVSGAAAIGGYAGTSTAPTNGLIVSGNVSIGTSDFSGGYALQVGYAHTSGANGSGDRYVSLPIGYETSPSHYDTAGIMFDSNNLWTNSYNGDSIFKSSNGIKLFGDTNNDTGQNPFTITRYQTADLTLKITTFNIGIGTTNAASKLTVKGNVGIGTYDSTAAPANGLIVSGSTGIATSSSSYTGNIGGDINISNTAFYRIGGLPVFSLASTTQWNGFRGGVLIGKQTETRAASSTGTYTPTSGTKNAVVEIWAGGGGGGGCDTTASGAGGGGGSGGYAVYYLTGVNGTYTFTIGQGGAGGAATGAAGNDGGNSTFVNGGTTITAFGGKGGTYTAGSVGIKFMLGGAGGAVSNNGSYNGAGTPGALGMTGKLATMAGSGNGGSTSLGGAGVGVVANTATCVNGNNAVPATGSGGSGGACGTTSGASGGTGGSGIIVIWEYK